MDAYLPAGILLDAPTHAPSPDSPRICAACGGPLTDQGSAGECLRCLVRFVFSPDDAEPKSSPDGFPSRPAVRTRHYGHFEIATAADGFPFELGSGAMGTTYRAQDTTLRTAVALKVIRQDRAAHPETRVRFLREARAAARLRHPNVAGVFHYGEQDGECFYAMELVEGETLETRVRRDGPLPLAIVLEIAVQVASALAAAESCGVIHRDLKPANIMLAAAGVRGGQETFTVKVIDFGLAKALTIDLDGPGPGESWEDFAGTPAFASPEHFARHPAVPIDTRSDIYSLGATLFYLLSGELPFGGGTLSELHARQFDPASLPLVQLKAARVPGSVVALLRSMLAPAPAGRPQSAHELLERLRPWQERFPLKPGRAIQRRPLFRALAGVGLVAAVAVLPALWWYRSSPPVAPAMRSVAVLPFDNLSPDPGDKFFTVGVQDEIVADLARIADLKVVGADSTRSYDPNSRDRPKIGRELGVRYLLDGSVRRTNGQVQVKVWLTDTGGPGGGAGRLWTAQYDRQLADVFAVQGEITRAVAAHLNANLTPVEKASIDRPPTSDLLAYDFYLRAAQQVQGVFATGPEAYRHYSSQVPLLEAAIARDPKFALAYCELAKAHDRLYFYRDSAPPGEPVIDHRGLAEAALAQARRLQPDAGELHLAEATHFARTGLQNEQARIEVDLARGALPNSAQVEGLAGEIARRSSRWDEAVRCLQRAVILEPRDNINRFTLANTYRLMRRYGDFEREMDRVIADLPQQASVAHRLFRTLGVLEQRGDLGPMRAAMGEALQAPGPYPEFANNYRLILALDTHDADAVAQALAATKQSRFMFNNISYPRAWFEALAARLRGDQAGSQAAFLAARPEVEKAVQADASNGPMLSLLAMIDAGLGHREEAVREARGAGELYPLEKSSIIAPIVAINEAAVYALTDQPALACQVLGEWINRPAGLNMPAQPTYGDLELNPLWDSIRDTPAFAALTARLAPPASH
jgi:TolB-like protein/tRNA A-37 threonylcarbamoyl transferase component Bud32/Flp pilus assembly protein TadD